MAKYQIIFNWGGSSKSYKYLDSEKNDAPKAAALVATEYKNESTPRIGSFGGLKYPKTVQVVEYDNVNKKPFPPKIGHRFKIQLLSITATYSNGRKERTEYYEPVN